MEQHHVEHGENARVTVDTPTSPADILMSLTPKEFFEFYARAFRADHSEQGGVRQSCEGRPWFPKVVSLFTERGGCYLSPEAARAANDLALIRNIIAGFAKDIIAAQERFPNVTSETDDPVGKYLYGGANMISGGDVR